MKTFCKKALLKQELQKATVIAFDQPKPDALCICLCPSYCQITCPPTAI